MSTSEETFLYVIANPTLGWRKVGIGFGSRLEKWRREGWVLEQQALFQKRESAMLAESLVKRFLRPVDDALKLCGLQPLAEGQTEAWPFAWGTVDLAAVKAAVDRLEGDMAGVMLPLLAARASSAWVFLQQLAEELGEEIPSQALELRESVLKVFREALEHTVVTADATDLSREDVQAFGLDWDELMRKRRDFRAMRAVVDTSTQTAT